MIGSVSSDHGLRAVRAQSLQVFGVDERFWLGVSWFLEIRLQGALLV